MISPKFIQLNNIKYPPLLQSIPSIIPNPTTVTTTITENTTTNITASENNYISLCEITTNIIEPPGIRADINLSNSITTFYQTYSIDYPTELKLDFYNAMNINKISIIDRWQGINEIITLNNISNYFNTTLTNGIYIEVNSLDPTSYYNITKFGFGRNLTFSNNTIVIEIQDTNAYTYNIKFGNYNVGIHNNGNNDYDSLNFNNSIKLTN